MCKCLVLYADVAKDITSLLVKVAARQVSSICRGRHTPAGAWVSWTSKVLKRHRPELLAKMVTSFLCRVGDSVEPDRQQADDAPNAHEQAC